MTMTIESDRDLTDEAVPEPAPEPASEPEGAAEPEAAKITLGLAFDVNGWEQLKISRLFKMALQQFGDDLVMACRIAIFVDGLRNGLSEGDAFQKAMVSKASEVLELVDMTDADLEGGDPLGPRTPTT